MFYSYLCYVLDTASIYPIQFDILVMVNLLIISGMVKKIAAQMGIGISHDRSKIHGGEVDECKSAISHTKESTRAINPLTYVLDPNLVLELFKGMSDKVYFEFLSIMPNFFYIVSCGMFFFSQNICISINGFSYIKIIQSC